MRKKMFSKVLSLMLMLSLILGMCPTEAFAASAEAPAENMTETVYEYVLDTDGVDADSKYLVVSAGSGNASALRNNNGQAESEQVVISDGKITGIANTESCLWSADGNGKIFSNTVDGRTSYILGGSNAAVGSTERTLTVEDQKNGAYRFSYTLGWPTYRLNYNDRSGWVSSTQNSNFNVYLFKQTVVKTVAETELLGTYPRAAGLNEEPDFSDVILRIVYNDGSEENIGRDGLEISGWNTNKIGTSYAVVSYNGTEYGTIKVTVPYTVLPEAPNYPEYPNPGAVRIKKTAEAVGKFESTGVAKVELDVAGISVKRGVDVVLVVDVSNSMAWSLENSAGNGTGDAAKLPNAGQKTKFQNVMEAASEFAGILLDDNVGTTEDNTLSFVTFAGYDKDYSASTSDKNGYVDSVMTVFSNVKDTEAAQKSFAGTSVTGTKNGTGANYTLKIADSAGTVLVNGANRGNTNYDYAFYQAQDAVQKIQTDGYAESGRETYIVFMTDGAPSHYNEDSYEGSKDRDYFPGISSGNAKKYQGTVSSGNWSGYITGNRNKYAQTLYTMVDGNFYAVGFDLANGGFDKYQGNEEILTNVLEHLVSTEEDKKIPVMTTSDADGLTELYADLARQIRLAGTDACVRDIINNDFTLQTAVKSGNIEGQQAVLDPAPAIEVIAYDLYDKHTVTGNHEIGERTGNHTVLEHVSFNEYGTEAYSDQLDGQNNIMSADEVGNVYIYAKYFTYKKDFNTGRETFEWNIGDITDKEIALSFDVYLKNSLEGGKDANEFYYTNEDAVLDYVDINGNHARKIFPMPAMPWGAAITAYEFYLVNADGKPVNSDGTPVSFENRVTISGPEYKKILLNDGVTIEADKTAAADVMPEGYFLYDNEAYYIVKTSSSAETVQGKLECSDPSADAKKTVNGVTQRGEQTTKIVSFDEDNYQKSHVAFGVRYEFTPEQAAALPGDQVVLDYGKAIQKNVQANDVYMENDKFKDGYTHTLVGFLPYSEEKDPECTQYVQYAPGKAELRTDNGTYSISENGQVRFKLHRMLSEVDRVFCVIEQRKQGTDAVCYLYEKLEVIPATNVYYETDFAENVFTFNAEGNDNGQWSVATDNTVKDSLQDTKEIGKDLYGFDSSYENDGQYSDRDSYFVVGVHPMQTTSRFSFTGTGFDIISMTGKDEGIIRVSVFSDPEMTALERKVSVLNKSESDLTLYQIPVVSIENLTYGTYYVEIGVSAPVSGLPIASLNNGGQFHFDAIRVFNPIDVSKGAAAEGDAAVAYEAYTADREAHAEIREVRNILIAKEQFDENADSEGVVFVDHDQSNVGMADYAQIGPNNEVYLTKTEDEQQQIGFKLQKTDGRLPESIDVGAKSADGQQVRLEAFVYQVNQDGTIAENPYTKIDKELTSCTIQFFDLFEDDGKTIADAYGSSDSIYIMIRNGQNGTGVGDRHILSITDLKTAYGKETGVTRIFSDRYTLDKTMLLAMPAEEPEENIVSAEFKKQSIKAGQKATMEVVTLQNAESLTVMDSNGRICGDSVKKKAQKDGTMLWTVTFDVSAPGTQTFTVSAAGQDRKVGAAVVVSLEVEAKNGGKK